MEFKQTFSPKNDNLVIKKQITKSYKLIKNSTKLNLYNQLQDLKFTDNIYLLTEHNNHKQK